MCLSLLNIHKSSIKKALISSLIGRKKLSKSSNLLEVIRLRATKFSLIVIAAKSYLNVKSIMLRDEGYSNKMNTSSSLAELNLHLSKLPG